MTILPCSCGAPIIVADNTHGTAVTAFDAAMVAGGPWAIIPRPQQGPKAVLAGPKATAGYRPHRCGSRP